MVLSLKWLKRLAPPQPHRPRKGRQSPSPGDQEELTQSLFLKSSKQSSNTRFSVSPNWGKNQMSPLEREETDIPGVKWGQQLSGSLSRSPPTWVNFLLVADTPNGCFLLVPMWPKLLTLVRLPEGPGGCARCAGYLSSKDEFQRQAIVKIKKRLVPSGHIQKSHKERGPASQLQAFFRFLSNVIRAFPATKGRWLP